jgi:hypothetical protein
MALESFWKHATHSPKQRSVMRQQINEFNISFPPTTIEASTPTMAFP